MSLKIQNKTKDKADIWIYGEIGEGWSSDFVTAKGLSDELKKLADVREITLRINSPGGNVFDGLAIYNSLKKFPAKIITEIDGIALSIASIVALAGDEVRMAGNAVYMIHNPWTMAVGDSTEMRKVADQLDLVRNSLAGTYSAKTGEKTTVEQISEWMNAETWFNSEEALKAGFVDEITDPIEIAAKYDLSRYHYKNMPKIAEKVAMPRDKAIRSMIARMTMKVKNRCLTSGKTTH